VRVLIVEDEALVAMLLEDFVEAAGHSVAAVATHIQEALALAGGQDFDVALLDLNLQGQRSHSLGTLLGRRGIPFAFVTGYGESGVLDAFAGAPVVTKPFTERDVARALETLAGHVSDSAPSAGRPGRKGLFWAIM
jgi:CheY-like chemotaxis protein